MRWTSPLALLALLLMTTPPRPAIAQPGDPTFDSAVFLLRQSTQVSQDGTHNVLLRALRHLSDPQLAPLFTALTQSDYPPFKIHGLLGLAESAADPAQRHVDLVRLAAVEDPAVQAELVSAALDSDLLTLDQCAQLVDWPGLDLAVKVIVSAPLVKAGRLPKTDALVEAAKAENLARRGLAQLLLLQLGHTDAMAGLDELSVSDHPTRDHVREMLLTTAVRYELNRIAPWAMKIVHEPQVRPPLALLALSVAIRFQTPGSEATWQEQFTTTQDIAQRMRLALMALRLSPWASPALYKPLLQQEDAMMASVGEAGLAVATGAGVVPAVVKLVEKNHPLANTWALSYASRDASPDDAKMILLSLILAYEQGPRRGREQRLDDAVTAAQLMAERTPDAAVTLLQPILANPATPRLLSQAILLGLIRAQSAHAHEVVVGLPALEDINTRTLQLLLLARHDQPLDPVQKESLALSVRGGGLPQAALRVQAAWLWLKMTNQTQNALQDVLNQ